MQSARFPQPQRPPAGLAAAAALTALILVPASAGAQMVDEGDARLTVSTVTFPGGSGQLLGYLALPSTAVVQALPAVVVIHGAAGLDDHTRDIARRLALEGYAALAPDFLSPAGGTPASPDMAQELIDGLEAEGIVGDLAAVAEFMRAHPATSNALGVIGFSWGGGLASTLAIIDQDLAAAVSFYGVQPARDEIGAIGARLLFHYAEDDPAVNVGINTMIEALEDQDIRYEAFLYADTGHGFFDDTDPERHDAEAAELAWERTLALLAEELGD